MNEDPIRDISQKIKSLEKKRRVINHRMFILGLIVIAGVLETCKGVFYWAQALT